MMNKIIPPRYPRIRNGYTAWEDIWQWANHLYQPKRPLGPSRHLGYSRFSHIHLIKHDKYTSRSPIRFLKPCLPGSTQKPAFGFWFIV
jgi:hypothetical protein